MSDIRNKLALLGMQLGKKKDKSTTTFNSSNFDFNSILDGCYKDTKSGKIFVSTKKFPIGAALGENGRLNFPQDVRLMQKYFKIDDLYEIDRSEIVYIDTETTGLAGGTGTYAFLVGIGFFDIDHFVLKQYVMSDPAEELYLLEALEQELKYKKATISYNGKSFDIPLLNTRFVVNGMHAILRNRKHIDLLHLSRKLWKNTLETCSLSCVEYYILDLLREANDISGSMIPQMYFEFLKIGDSDFFPDVIYHNEIDILSMVALFNLMGEYLMDASIISKCVDYFALGRFFETVGHQAQAIVNYKKALENDEVGDIKKRLSLLYKKLGNIEQAVRIWKEDSKDYYALIELAKYYEHSVKDFDIALDYADKACLLLNDNYYKNKTHLISDLAKRISRLKKKLDKTC